MLIGYDLDKPGQNYEKLSERIKGLGAWWHNLDSTWFVKTNKTAVQVRDHLQGVLDENDKLLVVAVTGDAWAGTGFKDSAYKWLKDNMSG